MLRGFPEKKKKRGGKFMKKLLVIFLSAVLVLSFAAASMAAATVTGDFRYEWYNETKTDDSYDNADLRVKIAGNVSDSVSAYLVARAQSLNYNKVLTIGGTDYKIGNDGKFDFYIDEWQFVFKQSYGTFTLGNWDWKTTPSRVLLKSAGFNILPRSEGNLAFDKSFGDFYAGAIMAIDESNDKKINDNGYDVKFGYKSDVWGAEAHYFDTKKNDTDTNVALDAWFKPSDNIKLYVYGNDYEPGYKGIDGFDPVIGAQFSKIAGTSLKVSIEYGIEARLPDTAAEWNEYALQLQYAFSNKVVAELEYQNVSDTDEKLVIRGKFAF
jgi:opacity protein-like surface antigen